MIDIYKFNFKKEKPDDELLLISVEEACKLTGIGRNTMLKFARLPSFPSTNAKRNNRIDPTKLKDWLLKNYSKYKP